MQVRHIANNNH